ncbi:MAG TPA: hypothetical protein VH813_04670 [Candidatus Limnocylindrales bacterium]|jgi:hypothetical protein
MTSLEAVEARLDRILDPYRGELEEFEIYGVPMLRRPGAHKHDWFAGVQRTDRAVKFNFLPMHGQPELLEGTSAALLKRRTGASVFKFTAIEEPLLDELESLVRRGFDSYLGRTPRRDG